jgi:uncharacterized protein YegL
MRTDLTDITLVVDRSGSMDSIRQDAEGGINAFIADQAKDPGEALLTLVQFDTEYEFIHRGVPIAKVAKFQLQPRGATALLDALGRAINETGSRLAAMHEDERPGLVIFVVMTDGLENSSREFNKAQIKQMIDHQQTAYNWHFTFLAANQDAFAEAADIGMAVGGAANFDAFEVVSAYAAAGAKVSRMRKQRSAGESVSNDFTEEERESMQ